MMVMFSSTWNIDEERQKTIENMSNDIFKIEAVLESIEGLTPEGEIIRDDLIGLLYFESDKKHQVDALMMERRKLEKKGLWKQDPLPVHKIILQ